MATAEQIKSLVRAYTVADTAFKGYNPVTEAGNMSPYNSTSELWNSKWPVKPDVLFDGGNMAANGSIHSDYCELAAAELCDCRYIAVFLVVKETKLFKSEI